MVEIDFSHLKEGTVTKPDGTVVTTVIVAEYDGTTSVTVTEKRPDGSEATRTVRKHLTGHDAEDMEEMTGEHKPGTETLPDGTVVTTKVEKHIDGSCVTTITEAHPDRSETTKVITVGADGSRNMKSHTVGIPLGGKPKPVKISPEEAKEMLKDVVPGKVTKPDGTVVHTTITDENGTKVTVIETANPDGSSSKRTIRESF